MAGRRRAETPKPTRAPRRLLAVVGALLAVVAAGLVLRGRGAGLGTPSRPNVLLVTVDTLRADRLGCYGHAGAETPHLDALAGRGVRFETAVAHAPLTAPSHASILTGLTPPRHGVRDNGGYVLPSPLSTLPEAFRAAGYATAAFVSGFPLDRRFGFARGFDVYDDRLPRGRDPRRAPYVERAADQTTDAALAWLSGRPRPWFAWVHYFDPHAPYQPPPDVASRFAGRPYDGEVAFADSQIGRLLRAADDGRSSTVVLVTADHGESLGEHGEETHGVFVYDSTLRVPLILAAPDLPGGRVATAVGRGVDVAPTLLDFAGLAPFGDAEGLSLRPAASGAAAPDRPAYAESLFAQIHLGWAPLHALRTATRKLVDAPVPELYALDADPGETANRIAGEREAAGALRRALGSVLAVSTPDATADVGGEARERLRALGYLAGGAPRAEPGRAPRDPKSGIALVNRLERGLADARTDPQRAARDLRAVLAEDPGIPLARRYLAIALASGGDVAGAVRESQGLERAGHASYDDLVLLGENLRLAGRPADALAVLDRAGRLQPGSPEARLTRARLLVALDRRAEARAVYEEVLAVRPSHPEALRGLADLALAAGDLAAAAEGFERILGGDPDDVSALVKRGIVEVRRGRLDQAEALFRRALERDPGDAEALLALGGAAAKAGRPAEAVSYFERARAAGHRSTALLNGLGFARLESGDTRGALAALRDSLALDPRQPAIADAVARLAAQERARSQP